MDTIDAPWVSSTIRSGITPGHASVGAMLALITQSRPHDSSTARTIEASANIENGPDESDEYRSRKRGRYSCLKCSTCRKDKKKVSLARSHAPIATDANSAHQKTVNRDKRATAVCRCVLLVLMPKLRGNRGRDEK
jgi:hypothetical protein